MISTPSMGGGLNGGGGGGGDMNRFGSILMDNGTSHGTSNGSSGQSHGRTNSVTGSSKSSTKSSTDLAADAWLLAHELHDILGHSGLDLTAAELPPLALMLGPTPNLGLIGSPIDPMSPELPQGGAPPNYAHAAGPHLAGHTPTAPPHGPPPGPPPGPTVHHNTAVPPAPPHIALFLAAHDGLPKNYLRLFYFKYGLWLMPLAPAGPNVFTTTVLATAIAVPFLTHAIMAITASFEFTQSGSTTDQYYRRHYTKLSLQGLTTAFSDKHTRPDQIVPLLLTSLLFVTDGAMDGTWRAHLRGASELFRRYLSSSHHQSRVQGQGGQRNMPNEQQQQQQQLGQAPEVQGQSRHGSVVDEATVGGVLVAASWFFSFEIIAVATSPGGGSIATASHLDDVLLPLTIHHALAVQMGLSLPDGFNIFLGLSAKTISVFVHFVKLCVRRGSATAGSVDELLPLMALFDEAVAEPVVSKSGIISANSPFYPRPHGPRFVPDECYGYENGTGAVYSWYDLSDKVHAYGLLLRVLTDPMYWGLPTTSPVVQDVVSKMLDWCYFLPGSLGGNAMPDRRMLMIHLSMMVCGSRCVRKEDTARVGEYFSRLKEMGVRTVGRLAVVAEGEAQQGDFVPYL